MVGRQFSLIYQLPPINMLPPAADAAGRTSAFFSLSNALKAFVVVTVNQGDNDTITVTPLQATTVAGAGSKGLTNPVPIALVDAAAVASLFVVQTPGTSFTTDTTEATKVIVFEIIPEGCMDVNNTTLPPFSCIAIQTGASNAANITAAHLFIVGAYEGSAIPDPLIGPPA